MSEAVPPAVPAMSGISRIPEIPELLMGAEIGSENFRSKHELPPLILTFAENKSPMKTIILSLILLNCFAVFSQDSTSLKKVRKVYFTPTLGIGSVSDTFMRNQMKRSTIKTFHADLMFGNLEKNAIHLITGINFSVAGELLGNDKTILFQTELGFRAHLNKNDLNKNPFFFKLSWIHGSNDSEIYHYNNEYNGLALGFGMTKPLDNLHTVLFVGMEYQANRQNILSSDKNGFMNLDLFQFNLGFTL